MDTSTGYRQEELDEGGDDDEEINHFFVDTSYSDKEVIAELTSRSHSSQGSSEEVDEGIRALEIKKSIQIPLDGYGDKFSRGIEQKT